MHMFTPWCCRGMPRQINNLGHLQPTEQDMQVGRARLESPSPAHAIDSPKPTEEQEQVPNTHLMIAQVAQCRSSLAEGRAPVSGARAAGGVEVGIEVNPVCGPGSR